jgi:hypothetical protein
MFIIAELNVLIIRERILKSTTLNTNSPIIKEAVPINFFMNLKTVPRGEHFTNSSTLQSLSSLYILRMIYGFYNVAVSTINAP